MCSNSWYHENLGKAWHAAAEGPTNENFTNTIIEWRSSPTACSIGVTKCEICAKVLAPLVKKAIVGARWGVSVSLPHASKALLLRLVIFSK